MAKLKNIIKQLSEKDYSAIYESLINGNAEKSAYLLKAMRERQLSENKVMVELEINANAYYTMRSRLSQKIEEYLVQQMESPRTDLLRKVANIHEVFFYEEEDDRNCHASEAGERTHRSRLGRRATHHLQASKKAAYKFI